MRKDRNRKGARENMTTCVFCDAVVPEELQKQIQSGFVFETYGWAHNENNNDVMCPGCCAFEENRE